MRRVEVFKIDGGRLLVDLHDIVAVEHRHQDGSLVLYTRGGHSFHIKAHDDDDDAGLSVIERWTGAGRGD